MPSELERALAFEGTLRTRCAERIVPFRFGHAYFNDSHPRVWYLNTLVVDGKRDVDPGELAAEAELLHTDAGQAHRHCQVLDEAVGAPLEKFFRRIGWQVDQELVMVHRGVGERSADTSAVEEVAREDLLLLRKEISRAEDWADDEEVIDEVLDANRLWEQAGNARYFAVRVNGAPVAAADLYSDGRIAQVEAVATLPDQQRPRPRERRRAASRRRGAGDRPPACLSDRRGGRLAEGAVRAPRVRGSRTNVGLPAEAREGRRYLSAASALPSACRIVSTPS